MRMIDGVRTTALALVAGSGLAAGLSGCTSWTPTDTGRQALSAPATGGLLDVETDNGSVEVRRADVSSLQIDATVRAVGMDRLAATKVVTEPLPEGGIKVRVIWPEGGRRGNEGCSLVIQTPSAEGVRIDTSNGHILLAGLGGSADLDTSNGRIDVSDHGGPVKADTSNGRIEMLRVTGDVIADTSNGRIEIIDAEGRIRADTSNGAIRLRLADNAAGPIDARTSNGSVRVEVGRAFAGMIDAKTSNGRVQVQGATGLQSGRAWAKASFGSGDARSIVATSNGSIDIVRAD